MHAAPSQDRPLPHLLMCTVILDELPPAPVLREGETLRAYTPSDRPALANMLNDAYAGGWDEERVQRTLVDEPSVKHIFVLLKDGRLVATASARLLPDLYPDAGYVHYVACASTYRRQRLGLAVTIRVMEYFRRLDLHAALLETQDFRLPAIRLYLGLGFVPVYRDDQHLVRWAHIFQRLLLQQ